MHGLAARPRAGAREHLARRDADPHGRLRAELAAELGRERRARLSQLEPGADGPQRIVFVARPQPEDADDRVPAARVGLGSVAGEDALACRGQPLEHRVYRFGVELLGQRGGVGEVGDRDRDRAARIRRGRRPSRSRRGRGGCVGRGRGECGIVLEHRLLQPPQALARLDAQVLDQRMARVLVGLQGIRLPVAAIQREHELRAQALAVRMLADERLEAAHDLGVAAEREVRVGELLLRRDPELLEAADLRLREMLVGEVRQRRPAPQGEPALQRRGRRRRAAGGELAPALLEQPLEAAGVQLLRPDGQHVAVIAGGEGAAAARERLPQPRDLHVEHARRGVRRRVAPELVDHALRREGLVGVDEQQGEQRSLTAPAERDGAPGVDHLERAEDAVLNGIGVGGRGATLPARGSAPQRAG